jgi:hypothetical protein
MSSNNVRSKILADLGINEPASFAQDTMITRLVDFWGEYQYAVDTLRAGNLTVVDTQHYRKMKVTLSKEIERLIKSLGLDKIKQKENDVNDYFKTTTNKSKRKQTKIQIES